MKKKEFKVLLMNTDKGICENYDILPFLRFVWEDWPYNIGPYGYVKVKTRESLKIWIEYTSVTHFWANDKYEFLMSPCRFGSYRWRVDLKALVKTGTGNGKNAEEAKLTSISTKDMIRLGVHEQIKMNIGIIADILYEEFLSK